MGQPNISQRINIDIILFSSIQPTTTHPLKMGNCPNSNSNVQSESMEMLEHELHIFFCNFFWPYSVVIDERRFRQFLAVTSREWQGGAFSGGKHQKQLELTRKNPRSKKFDAVLLHSIWVNSTPNTSTTETKRRQNFTFLQNFKAPYMLIWVVGKAAEENDDCKANKNLMSH